jgi:hypothetical protein
MIAEYFIYPFRRPSAKLKRSANPFRFASSSVQTFDDPDQSVPKVQKANSLGEVRAIPLRKDTALGHIVVTYAFW